jgi:hypothetical protein
MVTFASPVSDQGPPRPAVAARMTTPCALGHAADNSVRVIRRDRIRPHPALDLLPVLRPDLSAASNVTEPDRWPKSVRRSPGPIGQLHAGGFRLV